MLRQTVKCTFEIVDKYARVAIVSRVIVLPSSLAQCLGFIGCWSMSITDVMHQAAALLVLSDFVKKMHRVSDPLLKVSRSFY